MADPREQSDASPATGSAGDTRGGDAPRLGDTLSSSRSGRIDPDIGATQGGTKSHERASFSDPLTFASGEDAPADQRVSGSAPTTPAYEEPRGGDNLVDQGGFGGRATGHMVNGVPSPQRGTGTPVERADGEGLAGGR